MLSGFLSPVVVNYCRNNWKSLIDSQIESDEKAIKENFKKKIKFLFSESRNIKNDVRRKINKLPFEQLSEILKNYKTLIQIYDNQKNIIYWDSRNYLNQEIYLNQNNLNRIFFFDDDLNVYLTTIDTITTPNIFYVSVNLPIEKKYKLSNKDKFVSWSEFLSKSLNTSVEVNYTYAKLIRNGKFHSTELINNKSEVIGEVLFEKPSVDFLLSDVIKVIRTLQLFLFLLIFLYLINLVISFVRKSQKNYVKFICYSLIVLSLRILLFIFNFPSSYIRNSLTDASNFSSKFAFGIVKSPLEFTLTIITLFIIISTGFKYFIKWYNEGKTRNNNWVIFIGLILINYFLILLLWRGMGASIRSVIFDSTIRYFKEFKLIPEAPALLMDFNILMFGISLLIFSIMLLLVLFYYIPVKNNKNKFFKALIILFFCLQIFGLVFDTLQKNPQGTPIIRVIFLSTIFLLAYVFNKENFKSITKYVYISFGASIVTVSLLTYYNSEIERESLKTTAYDLTRANQNIYQFIVYQTLYDIQNNNSLKDAFLDNKNFYSSAFLVWSKSMLYKESIPSAIAFYNAEKKQVGTFSSSIIDFGINENLEEIDVNEDDIVIKIIPNIYGDDFLIKGIVAIKNNNKILGYALIYALYEEINFRFLNVPKYFLAEQQGISSAIDYERVKIFYFNDKELVKSYGALSLSKNDIKTFINASFNNTNEAWLNISLSDEKFLFYILKLNDDSSKILAVGKAEKSFTWNLSDFFKVFFVHSIIILFTLILISLWNYKELLKFLQSYRTKIAVAFLFIAIIPLIIFALYIKNITEENAREFRIEELSKYTEQLKNYLSVYENSTIKDSNLIFLKASKDLGIEFSVFDNKYLNFSTEQNLYKANLLPVIVPFNVYNNLILKGYDKAYFINELENNPYTSVYFKIIFNGKNYLIEVNDLLNKIRVSVTDKDVNVFMFGIISLAVILIIIVSTLLANQIYLPVKKLTHATRSVGSGDLTVEIKGNYTGEILELTEGFNKMVEQLRKSQFEMVKLEREAAWREMAKQVAHEIKNPLTPMKLSVQQLIIAYKDKSPKFGEIFDKVTATIINQIEVLKNIATEFSNFARMPKLNVNKVNLGKIINETINLFTDEKLSIKLISEKEFVVNADEEHLNRTFINLIRNSIQAEAKNILIIVKEEQNYCAVRISDDGTGIPEEFIEKVFEENFTTKKHGMGLGLSMTKKFLNSIGGTIEIENTSEKGTTFLIKIPLAE
ncbi:sensor histidine kinase [Rosettibacter firmus]|uniref:sensor histidine kinase n=1 Tax=Rosettibacter firmus TaxID=3111522 RepID=UPI00336C2AB8